MNNEVVLCNRGNEKLIKSGLVVLHETNEGRKVLNTLDIVKFLQEKFNYNNQYIELLLDEDLINICDDVYQIMIALNNIRSIVDDVRETKENKILWLEKSKDRRIKYYIIFSDTVYISHNLEPISGGSKYEEIRIHIW